MAVIVWRRFLWIVYTCSSFIGVYLCVQWNLHCTGISFKFIFSEHVCNAYIVWYISGPINFWGKWKIHAKQKFVTHMNKNIHYTHTHMHKLFCRERELWAMTAINLTVRTGNKRLTLLTNMRVLRYINIDLDPNRSMFYVQQLWNTSGSGNGCRWCCFKMVFRFICYHIECT